MFRRFEDYAKEKHLDYIDDSGYLCDDGITFLFKVGSDDNIHRLIFDLSLNEIVEMI